MRDYLDLKDSLVVDGLLLLPEKLPEKDQAELLEKISGKGKVKPSICLIDIGGIMHLYHKAVNSPRIRKR